LNSVKARTALRLQEQYRLPYGLFYAIFIQVNIHYIECIQMNELLLSKQGLAVTRIAQALLEISPGDRVEPVQEQSSRHGASVGTIQAALDYLHTSGAATIEARGRLGSFAISLDYPQLWSFAQRRALVGALPLPYARRIEGLATGLRQQCNQHALELSMRFMRGSTQRLQSLSAGEYDWAIMSRFAAETASSHGFDIDIVSLLGPYSYMAGHVIVTRANEPLGPGDTGLRPGMRIGIDLRSTDHAYSVRSIVRGMSVTFVPIEYQQGLRLVREAAIDATIWSQGDPPTVFSDLNSAPFDTIHEVTLTPLSEAAIVTHSGNRAVANLLGAVIQSNSLHQIQEAIVSGQRLPEY
jgi:hypothetical protein